MQKHETRLGTVWLLTPDIEKKTSAEDRNFGLKKGKTITIFQSGHFLSKNSSTYRSCTSRSWHCIPLILYLPVNWITRIISLNKNSQCARNAAIESKYRINNQVVFFKIDVECIEKQAFYRALVSFFRYL